MRRGLPRNFSPMDRPMVRSEPSAQEKQVKLDKATRKQKRVTVLAIRFSDPFYRSVIAVSCPSISDSSGDRMSLLGKPPGYALLIDAMADVAIAKC